MTLREQFAKAKRESITSSDASWFVMFGAAFRSDPIEHWIALPINDGGLTPTDAALGNADLFWKSALLDLAV